MRTSRNRLSLAAGSAAVFTVVAAGCGGPGAAVTIGGDVAPQTSPPPSGGVTVGPGPVQARILRSGYAVVIHVSPNRATTRNRITVSVSRGGVPVTGARVGIAAGMLTMDMGVGHYPLLGTTTYRATLPAWQMPGRWGLAVTVRPPGAAPVRVVLDDAVRG